MTSDPFALFDEWWAPYLLGVGPYGAYVASLDDATRTELAERCRALLPEPPFEHAATAWVVVTAGAKGCVSFMPDRIRNFRDFRSLDGRYGHAHWLVQHNRGAFLPPWGKVEQWLMSVQHTDEDVDRFVANCEQLAEQLTGTSRS